jgi:enoyl-CoA hydratase/carnithine racemase
MMAQTSDLIETSIYAGILEINLCRPERKNALNQAMYRDLTVAIEEGVQDPQVMVILLAGSCGCFTSGNDLADFANAPEMLNDDNVIVQFMAALTECSKPVVVAVEGPAVGIGTTLLLHVDLVYAAPDASFRLPFVSLGLCPEYASSWLLPRLVGHVRAAEWLLLGEAFSASEAQDAGLINAVVDEPLAVARSQAQKLARQPPVAVRTAKALMKQPNAEPIKAAMARELLQFAEALQGQEFKKAVSAFFERSKQ